MSRNTLPTALTPGFVNPRTGHHVRPGEIIGYRKDGRPIIKIAGGSGEGGDGGSGSDGGDGSGSDGDGDQGDGGNAGQGDGGDGKKPQIKGEFDPERHARSLQAARDGEAKAKTAAKAATDRLASVLKAAGLTPDGKEDPAEALKASTAKAEAATAKARDAAIELAVYKAAGKAGADATALLDSRGFLNSVSELDPESADFGDKITAAIKAAVKNNAKLAAGTTGQGSGSGRQGADHTGGGTKKARSGNLTDAVKRKLGG